MIDLPDLNGGSGPGGLIGVIMRALGLLKGGPMTGAQAGRVKLDYLLGGGDPEKVVSPERYAALKRGGPSALLAMPASKRADGSIAAGYKPTATALRQGLIEPAAIDTVKGAERAGLRTVSSGVDRRTGNPFAIGVGPDGQVREIRGRRKAPT